MYELCSKNVELSLCNGIRLDWKFANANVLTRARIDICGSSGFELVDARNHLRETHCKRQFPYFSPFYKIYDCSFNGQYGTISDTSCGINLEKKTWRYLYAETSVISMVDNYPYKIDNSMILIPGCGYYVFYNAINTSCHISKTLLWNDIYCEGDICKRYVSQSNVSVSKKDILDTLKVNGVMIYSEEALPWDAWMCLLFAILLVLSVFFRFRRVNHRSVVDDQVEVELTALNGIDQLNIRPALLAVFKLKAMEKYGMTSRQINLISDVEDGEFHQDHYQANVPARMNHLSYLKTAHFVLSSNHNGFHNVIEYFREGVKYGHHSIFFKVRDTNSNDFIFKAQCVFFKLSDPPPPTLQSRFEQHQKLVAERNRLELFWSEDCDKPNHLREEEPFCVPVFSKVDPSEISAGRNFSPMESPTHFAQLVCAVFFHPFNYKPYYVGTRDCQKWADLLEDHLGIRSSNRSAFLTESLPDNSLESTVGRTVCY